MPPRKTLSIGFLKASKSEMVWDLGSNVGDFSRIASAQGAMTMAFDYDHGAG